jgi:AraC-like DNA-binding protein
MGLLGVLTRDRVLEGRLFASVTTDHTMVSTRSWDGLRRVIRERPTTDAIVDLSAVPPRPSMETALAGLRIRFPHLGLVLLVPPGLSPFGLFRLGKAGIRNLILLGIDDLDSDLGRALARAKMSGATSLVGRFLSPYLPRREFEMAITAMESVHRRWSADGSADWVGLSRPFLSERFKKCGLPSVGHFLLWTRLFHAGHWLEEPGRTGESVGRQLEYSSGAAFRRALKHYTHATPMGVREGGGLRLIFRAFLRQTGLNPVQVRFRGHSA